MRKTSRLISRAVIVSLAICAGVSAQSSPKRHAPALTTDDISAAPRQVVRVPPESDARQSTPPRIEAHRGPIAWHRDLRQAFEVANADGKLVIVDVYTDWCGWCKKMDQTIYSNPMIAGLSSQQVFVRVNAEDRGQGQNFAEQMQVRGYPTTIILDGNGRVLNIEEGFIESPQAFVKFVQAAQAVQAR